MVDVGIPYVPLIVLAADFMASKRGSRAQSGAKGAEQRSRARHGGETQRRGAMDRSIYELFQRWPFRSDT